MSQTVSIYTDNLRLRFKHTLKTTTTKQYKDSGNTSFFPNALSSEDRLAPHGQASLLNMASEPTEPLYKSSRDGTKDDGPPKQNTKISPSEMD